MLLIGLEQAWTCLLSVLHTGSELPGNISSSTSSLSALSDDISEGLRITTENLGFRKIQSEPINCSSSHVDFTDNSDTSELYHAEDSSVSFYLGN